MLFNSYVFLLVFLPIALIGFDPAVFGTAANNGRMIAETDGKHASVEAFQQIAHLLTGRTEAKKAKKPSRDFLGRLRRK
jgi:pilus assembly protein CpaE